MTNLTHEHDRLPMISSEDQSSNASAIKLQICFVKVETSIKTKCHEQYKWTTVVNDVRETVPKFRANESQ